MGVRRSPTNWREKYTRADAARRHYEAHYCALAENKTYGTCCCNNEGKFVEVNQALVRMLGYKSKKELLAANLGMDIVGNSRRRARLFGPGRNGDRSNYLLLKWVRKDGTATKVRVSGRAVQNDRGDVEAYELIVESMDQQRALEEQLRRMADTDALTNLATYRRLQQVLDGEMRRSKRTERMFSVLLLDLNGLKHLNDVYGHLTGNRALCRVADALRQCCRSIDTPTRFGGDEFVLVLPETDALAARKLAARILRYLAVDREEPKVMVSVGFATYPRDGEKTKDLLDAADKALYKMKYRKQPRQTSTNLAGYPSLQRRSIHRNR
jgi:diguanylate cyclase (GGDEF)-like protein/PAS domain S-box-containing protein